MPDSALSLFLSRLDSAWITTFHIIYPPLTIGLAMLLFLAEWRWIATDDEHWYRLVRFFERLFIVNFAAGVATGITMEMAFGILYGPFSQAAGPFFGQVLGYETITAFMYEAGFIGLMIFGWGKIGRGLHLFATFNVALSASLSAMWILDANSWMQTPSGVELHSGVFQVTNWFAALFNPDVLLGFPHMLIAAVELALCFVIAVAAWFVLCRRHVALFQRPLKYVSAHRESYDLCCTGSTQHSGASLLSARPRLPISTILPTTAMQVGLVQGWSPSSRATRLMTPIQPHVGRASSACRTPAFDDFIQMGR